MQKIRDNACDFKKNVIVFFCGLLMTYCLMACYSLRLLFIVYHLLFVENFRFHLRDKYYVGHF